MKFYIRVLHVSVTVVSSPVYGVIPLLIPHAVVERIAEDENFLKNYFSWMRQHSALVAQ